LVSYLDSSTFRLYFQAIRLRFIGLDLLFPITAESYCRLWTVHLLLLLQNFERLVTVFYKGVLDRL
jgi:hypothetical protein